MTDPMVEFARLGAIHDEIVRSIDRQTWWSIACLPAAATLVLLPLTVLGLLRARRETARLELERDEIVSRRA